MRLHLDEQARDAVAVERLHPQPDAVDLDLVAL
jgi:hypothetical protein